MTTQIKITTSTASIGEGWDDETATARAYNNFVAEKLKELYPDATVQTEVFRGDGPRPVTVYTADGVDHDMQDEIQELVQSSLWDDFCKSEVAKGL